MERVSRSSFSRVSGSRRAKIPFSTACQYSDRPRLTGSGHSSLNPEWGSTQQPRVSAPKLKRRRAPPWVRGHSPFPWNPDKGSTKSCCFDPSFNGGQSIRAILDKSFQLERRGSPCSRTRESRLGDRDRARAARSENGNEEDGEEENLAQRRREK